MTSNDFMKRFGQINGNGSKPSDYQIPPISSFTGYDPSIHTLNGPLNTTPISAQATAANSKNVFKAPPSKLSFPYLIISAPHSNSNVFLHDVDSKRILLTYDGELTLTTSKGITLKKSYDKINTIHGDQKGYVFYKGTKEHMDLLDQLFNPEWRQELRVPLPVVEEKTPVLLWSGDIAGSFAQLFEYSEIALALFVNGPVGSSNFFLNTSLTHPDGKRNGYIISKTKGKGIDDLRKMIPIDFGALYTKSAPVSAAPVISQSLIEKGNMIKNDTVIEVELWSYSPAAYALFLNPHIPLESTNMTENKLKVNGMERTGYSMAKSNTYVINELKTIFPNINLEENTAMIITNGTLASTIPPVKKEEKSIEEIIISLAIKMPSLTMYTRKEIFGKVIYYGPEAEVESAVGNETESRTIFLAKGNGNSIVVLELIN